MLSLFNLFWLFTSRTAYPIRPDFDFVGNRHHHGRWRWINIDGEVVGCLTRTLPELKSVSTAANTNALCWFKLHFSIQLNMYRTFSSLIVCLRLAFPLKHFNVYQSFIGFSNTAHELYYTYRDWCTLSSKHKHQQQLTIAVLLFICQLFPPKTVDIFYFSVNRLATYFNCSGKHVKLSLCSHVRCFVRL